MSDKPNKPSTPVSHGFAQDMQTMAPKLFDRRRALQLFSAASATALVVGCGGGSSGGSGSTTVSTSTDTSSTSDTTSSTDSSTTDSSSTDSSATTDTSTDTSTDSDITSCVADPEETNGPYPADGSNRLNGSTVNVLTQSGVIRSDIRSSFGSYSGTADGVPVVLNVTLVNTNNSCAPLAGYALYLWHCDSQGNYSLYSSGYQSANFLRGMQVSDSSGRLSFTTIFPGCYDGRWPHTHFEVFATVDDATHYTNRLLCSQMAMDSSACSAVYNNDSRYSSSVSNFSRISLSSDNVFRDNSSAQVTAMTPTLVSGNYADGYTMSVVVGIAV